ncbi:MAG: hypothetical protein HC896_09730 [Bacteroidales bacterium]|nr:hypothetical protein [Bacteroidales bacterium]
MSKKNKHSEPDTVETIESALTRTEQYIEDNQKSLTIIFAVIVAIFEGTMATKGFC